MNDIADDRVGPMLNPPHLGELIRESMDDVGWNVTETASRLGCERGTLSRLLNGKAGVSANMALALEDIGWGTADHWMRMQASYELAQARRGRPSGRYRGRVARLIRLPGPITRLLCTNGRTCLTRWRLVGSRISSPTPSAGCFPIQGSASVF